MPPSFIGLIVPGSPTMSMTIEPPNRGESAALGDAPPAATTNARTPASPASCRGRIWELVDIERLLLLIKVREIDPVPKESSPRRHAPRPNDRSKARSIDAPAAIDNQRGTSHKAPSRASQIDGGGGDLLGLREAFEWRAVDPSLAVGRIA